ncbi:MAG: ATP-grasp domain-containing protein [Candidatus Riflebacteria bacterium]|nr:ATP-grasp domain-containing protein [Candidatus Riflebacteria bacterium]
MRVVVLSNSPASPVVLPLESETASASGERWESEAISDRAVEGVAWSVANALLESGHDVVMLQAGNRPEDVIAGLRDAAPDAVFNLCETIGGDSRLEAAVPYLLSWLDIPFTGNPPGALAMLVDKVTTKALFASLGVRTPECLTLGCVSDLDEWNIWPAILKPAAEDASLGIDAGSVVRNAETARSRFELLAARFGIPVLIERFITGREVNVAVLETENGLKTGINEIDFSTLPSELPPIVTYEAKWVENSNYYKSTPVKSPANLQHAVDRIVRDTALSIFSALDLSGYARIDFRIDNENLTWVLEVNPNPDLSDDAGFARSLPEMGLGYREAVDGLVRVAIARHRRRKK